MGIVEELLVPLSRLLCSRCSARVNHEDLNDLRGIILPLLGSDLPLYLEVGQVHGGLEKLSLWSTCTRLQEGLAAMSCGPWRCRGTEGALGIIRLLCSDMLGVRLCRLGPAFARCTF
jgi:hypothetical protein